MRIYESVTGLLLTPIGNSVLAQSLGFIIWLMACLGMLWWIVGRHV
mgnify:CR=1 FL=1